MFIIFKYDWQNLNLSPPLIDHHKLSRYQIFTARLLRGWPMNDLNRNPIKISITLISFRHLIFFHTAIEKIQQQPVRVLPLLSLSLLSPALRRGWGGGVMLTHRLQLRAEPTTEIMKLTMLIIYKCKKKKKGRQFDQWIKFKIGL